MDEYLKHMPWRGFHTGQAMYEGEYVEKSHKEAGEVAKYLAWKFNGEDY